jgi:RadC-like JAB domain
MRFRARLAVSPISEASSKRQGDGQRFQKKAMKTTNQKDEAAAPANVRPSSVSKMTMNTTPLMPGVESLVQPFKFPASPYEYKVTPLRECPTPDALQQCDTPDKAAEYWKLHVGTHPHFNPECECLAVLLLNARRRIKGHQLVSIGTQDTILVHPREVFRLAVTTAANALILMHCHPSGDSNPSDADIKVTRDLIRAGQILKIEVLDHVIIGSGNFSSLKALGYCCA